MRENCCSRRRGRSFKSSSSALAVLAFATKHSTINISLLSLQKTTLFQSQSSDYTVHNKFAFMNYTDGEHSGIKRAIQKRTGQSALHIARFCLLHTVVQTEARSRWFQWLPSKWGHKHMNNISRTALRVTPWAFYHLIWVKLASYHIHTEL